MHRQIDRQIDRQIKRCEGRQTDRQIDRFKDRQIDRYIDRQKNRKKDIQAGRKTDRKIKSYVQMWMITMINSKFSWSVCVSMTNTSINIWNDLCRETNMAAVKQTEN